MVALLNKRRPNAISQRPPNAKVQDVFNWKQQFSRYILSVLGAAGLSGERLRSSTNS